MNSIRIHCVAVRESSRRYVYADCGGNLFRLRVSEGSDGDGQPCDRDRAINEKGEESFDSCSSKLCLTCSG